MSASTSTPQPTSKPTIFISVLGPPGAGKGTQCALLSTRFQCTHLSIGDLLRDEVCDPESPYAEILKENLKEGKLGKKEMTCGILKRRVDKGGDEVVVLLDGFPRAPETAAYFEQTVAPISALLILHCASASTLSQRLMSRQRADDDEAIIRKRIDVYEQTTAKVVEHYAGLGKVVRIEADGEVEGVAEKVLEGLEGVGVRLERRE